MAERKFRTESAKSSAMPGQDRPVCFHLSADLFAKLERISRKENRAKGALIKRLAVQFIEEYQHG